MEENCKHEWQEDFDHNTRYCGNCGITTADDLEHYDKDAIGESFTQRDFLHQLSAAQAGNRTLDISRYQNEKLREAKLQMKDVLTQLDLGVCVQRVNFIIESAIEYSKKPKRSSTFKFGKQSLCFEMAAIKYVAAQEGHDMSWEYVSSFFSHLVDDGSSALAEDGRSGKPRVTKLDVGKQLHFIEWLARHGFKPTADDKYIPPGYEAEKGGDGEQISALTAARLEQEKARKSGSGRRRRGADDEPVGHRNDYIGTILDAFDRDLEEITQDIPALADPREHKSVKYLRAVRPFMDDARSMARILAEVMPSRGVPAPQNADVRAESAIIALLAMQAASEMPAPKNTLFYALLTRITGIRAPRLGTTISFGTDWLNDKLCASGWFDTRDVFMPGTFRGKKTTQRSGNIKRAVTVPEWKRLIREDLASTIQGGETQSPSAPAAPSPSLFQVQQYRLALQRAKLLVAVWKLAGGTPPDRIRWWQVYECFPPSLWTEATPLPQTPMEDGKPFASLQQLCEENHPDVERYMRYLNSNVPLSAIWEEPLAHTFSRSFDTKLWSRLKAAGGLDKLGELSEGEGVDRILFEPDELEGLVRTAEEVEYYSHIQRDQVADWEEQSKINNARLDAAAKKARRPKRIMEPGLGDSEATGNAQGVDAIRPSPKRLRPTFEQGVDEDE